MKSYAWLILSLSVLLSACPQQTPPSTAKSPPTSKPVKAAPEKGVQAPESDPLLSSAYVRYPFDEHATLYGNAEDAWWDLGTEGTGEGVPMEDFKAGMDRLRKGLVKQYILPQHTLVEVLAERAHGQDSIIKVKLIGVKTVKVSITRSRADGENEVTEKEVSADGLVLYAFSDDIVRKGTYKTSADREAAEAAEDKAVAKMQYQAEHGPFPIDRVRFERK